VVVCELESDVVGKGLRKAYRAASKGSAMILDLAGRFGVGLVTCSESILVH